ncbi:MAG: S8 family serine peptidase [Sedimentisphaerales bacterium]|nr:S8 family serine peptidase [Sedimentisphaerales bacterium]
MIHILRRFPVFILLICVLVSTSRAGNRRLDLESLDSDSYVPGELIIRFAPQRGDRVQVQTMRENRLRDTISDARIDREFSFDRDVSLVELPTGVSVKDAINQLAGREDILYVEPNFKVQAFQTFPNDPCFGLLWGLHNTGQTVNGVTGTVDCDIDAPEAWDIITDVNDIIVAVIDTGVEYTHPDLAANIWINQAELNGDPNKDDDNNSYVDDIYGYDFYNDDVDPMDDNRNYHGTHCAGTFGAVGNNAVGVTGVCWNETA